MGIFQRVTPAAFNGAKFAMNATPRAAAETCARVDGLEWRRGRRRLRISGNAILQFLHPFDE